MSCLPSFVRYTSKIRLRRDRYKRKKKHGRVTFLGVHFEVDGPIAGGWVRQGHSTASTGSSVTSLDFMPGRARTLAGQSGSPSCIHSLNSTATRARTLHYDQIGTSVRCHESVRNVHRQQWVSSLQQQQSPDNIYDATTIKRSCVDPFSRPSQLHNKSYTTKNTCCAYVVENSSRFRRYRTRARRSPSDPRLHNFDA